MQGHLSAIGEASWSVDIFTDASMFVILKIHLEINNEKDRGKN